MRATLKNAQGMDLQARNGGKIDIAGLSSAVVSYTAPIYEGAYEVIPKAYEEQRLATKDKTMREDVTVDKVPFYEVSNPSGGITCYIAEEALKWE